MSALRHRLTRSMDARSLKGVEIGPYAVGVEKGLRVPMDDGSELLADLYRPVGSDASLPTVVIRGPYGRNGMLGASARVLAYEGFTVLFQSSRGTFGSAGVFQPQLDEQRDGISTLKWVRAQPWFTGRLASFGESYMGYTQWAVAGKLQAEEPDVGSEAYVLQITMPDFGAITWDNGAFALQNALGWTRMMDRMAKGGPAMLGILLPDPKLEKAFDVLPLSAGDTAATGHPIDWYQDWVKYEDLSHEYWTQQSHTASVPEVTAPVLMVTGWYDIFAPWQLRNYRQLVEAGRPPLLTVGPWGHRSKGKAAPAHQESVAFLKHALAGEPWDRAAPVRAFQTGAEVWHDLAEWPPAGSQSESWLLGRDGDIATDHASSGLRTYSYNPEEPTPAVGGPSLKAKTEPLDNRAHEKRSDVLVYRSAVLTDPLEIAGEPVAHIRIRASAPSFDVFVRITDVHPDGRSITVCDGIRRIGSVGTHASDPSADSDDFRDVSVGLWPTFHQIAPGHRLGIQVSSGAHPRYARNPGTGEPAFEASRTVVANQEIAHGGPVGSRIELPVWSR